MEEKQIFGAIEGAVTKDIRQHQLSADFKKLCVAVLAHYQQQFSQIKNQFGKALNKYTFSHLAERGFVNQEDYIHVFLALEQTCKDTYICLDEGGGIHDLDFQIGKISEEPPLTFYNELGFFDSLSGEFDEWDKFHTKILLTVLVYIWLDAEGFKKGIVLKSNENTSVEQFFFNDCKWNEKSAFFNNINWVDDLKIFQVQKKTIKEIYDLVGER